MPIPIDPAMHARYVGIMGLIDTVRMDKTAFSVGRLGDEGDEKAYWQSKTPEERLAAVELMRQIAYGYDPSTTRLQRILSVTRREPV
jgi:hypothetical protein